jgi:hypothetical protein
MVDFEMIKYKEEVLEEKLQIDLDARELKVSKHLKM